jgi:hypothetical protein
MRTGLTVYYTSIPMAKAATIRLVTIKGIYKEPDSVGLSTLFAPSWMWFRMNPNLYKTSG